MKFDLRHFLGRFYNKRLIIGFIALFSVIIISAVGLQVIPIDPLKVGVFEPNLPPNVLRVFMDVFLVIPMLPVMILIGSIMKWSVPLMGVSFVIFTWAWTSRTIRSQILSLKQRDFIELARLSGMREIKILFIEIFPHLLPWILSSFIYAIMWVMINEAGLSFLGLGPFNNLTFGMIIYWAFTYGSLFRGLWWAWVPAIIMLTLIFICLYIISMGFDQISKGS